MGARTWDFMVAHGSWPYAGKPTWIVTHAEELAELPGAEPVETFEGDPAELVRLIESRGLNARGSSAAATSRASCLRPTCSTS